MKAVINFFKNHQIFSIALMVLVVGAAGGIGGNYIYRNYLADDSFNFSGGRYTDQGLVIANAKNVIVQQDAKVDETINAVSSSLVGIYKKQKTVKSEFSPDSFYKLSAAAGQGFAITADGWIVTALDLGKNYADYAAVTKDKKIYPLDRAITDKLTGLSIVHVGAADFPVRKLALRQEINKGNLTIGVNWAGLSLVSAVSGFNDKSGALKSSDSFTAGLILNSKLPAEFKGAVIFNLAGDALGIDNGAGEIIPLSYLNGAVKELFKNQKAIRPSLGVNYYNLSELVPGGGLSGDWQKGAVIYHDQKNAAVAKNSPAEAVGLKEGDIIISVDGVNLDKTNDLAEIILNYLPGDKISLTFLRAGQEKTVELTLAEKK